MLVDDSSRSNSGTSICSLKWLYCGTRQASLAGKYYAAQGDTSTPIKGRCVGGTVVYWLIQFIIHPKFTCFSIFVFSKLLFLTSYLTPLKTLIPGLQLSFSTHCAQKSSSSVCFAFPLLTLKELVAYK